MIFEIVFDTHTGSLDSIQYKLRKNEIVDAWLACLLYGDKNLNYNSYNLHNINIQDSEATIFRAYKEIEKKLLKKHNNIFIGKSIDQKTLNKLHAVFTYYQDRYREYNLDDEASQKYLQDLNREIHNLEIAHEDDDGFMLILDPVINYTGRNVKELWYKKYFSELPQNGDLLLGYATAGKELLEVYNTNNTDNLDLISPQKNVYGECRLWFQSYYKLEKDLNIKKLKDWCFKKGKTDIKDNELYTFRPKLGHIITDLSYKDLRIKCSNFKEIVNWELKNER